MVRKSDETLSAAEWKVMRLIWQRKSCSAREVYEQASADYGWAPTTTKTLLARLVEKGYLHARQVGNSNLYRPTQPAIKTLTAAADRLLSHAVEGTVGPLVAHLVKKHKLSDKELAELRAILDSHKK
jgi:predicted transcriptional regulator